MIAKEKKRSSDETEEKELDRERNRWRKVRKYEEKMRKRQEKYQEIPNERDEKNVE